MSIRDLTAGRKPCTGMWVGRLVFLKGNKHPSFIIAEADSSIQIKNGTWHWKADAHILCDTAAEAESVRLLLEREREEIEAVRRTYERKLLELIGHG